MSEVRKFCLPSKTKARLITIIIVIFGSFPLAFAAVSDFRNKGEYFPMFCISGFFYIIAALVHRGAYGKAASTLRKRMNYFRKNGLEGQIVGNFQNSVNLFGGHLKAGPQCMFGFNTGMIVFYNEIDAVSRHRVEKRYRSGKRETDTYIEVRAGRKKYRMCNMDHFTLNIKEWMQFINFMKLKAPNVFVNPNEVYRTKYIDDTSSRNN